MSEYLDADNRCPSCGAHFSDPHDPHCETPGIEDGDDDMMDVCY